MNNTSLMQKALGSQWQQLAPALQAHYQHNTNSDIGHLDIEYPVYMHPYLTLLRLAGALINRRGTKIPTTVEKYMQDDIQYWKRSIRFQDNKTIYFKSFWIYDKNNELIEFVNSFLGLRMAVHIQNKKLHYQGRHFVIKIGKWLIPVPEWLVLGHTTITETAISDDEFEMDFRLKHPLFGTVFRYSGKFKNTAV